MSGPSICYMTEYEFFKNDNLQKEFFFKARVLTIDILQAKR